MSIRFSIKVINRLADSVDADEMFAKCLFWSAGLKQFTKLCRVDSYLKSLD